MEVNADDIIKFYLSGKTIKEICKIFHIGSKKAHQILIDANINIKKFNEPIIIPFNEIVNKYRQG